MLAAIAAVLGLVIALASFFVAQATSGETRSMGSGDMPGKLFGIPIYYALLAVLAVGSAR